MTELGATGHVTTMWSLVAGRLILASSTKLTWLENVWPLSGRTCKVKAIDALNLGLREQTAECVPDAKGEESSRHCLCTGGVCERRRATGLVGRFEFWLRTRGDRDDPISVELDCQETLVIICWTDHPHVATGTFWQSVIASACYEETTQRHRGQ